MSQFRPRPRGTSNINVSLSLDSGASHSSRHDMLAIISSRYQYGPFSFLLLQKLSNYLTTDGLKKFSQLPEALLRPVAFATSATWLIRHWLCVCHGVHRPYTRIGKKLFRALLYRRTPLVPSLPLVMAIHSSTVKITCHVISHYSHYNTYEQSNNSFV